MTDNTDKPQAPSGWVVVRHTGVWVFRLEFGCTVMGQKTKAYRVEVHWFGASAEAAVIGPWTLRVKTTGPRAGTFHTVQGPVAHTVLEHGLREAVKLLEWLRDGAEQAMAKKATEERKDE